MKLIEWSDELKINVKSLDEQHEEMVKSVNELYSLLGRNKVETNKHLTKRLLDGLRRHFDLEEELMKQYMPVGDISHKLEHDRFYSKISDFYDKLIAGEEKVNLKLLNSIKNWFLNHIEINDSKLGNSINSSEKKE